MRGENGLWECTGRFEFEKSEWYRMEYSCMRAIPSGDCRCVLQYGRATGGGGGKGFAGGREGHDCRDHKPCDLPVIQLSFIPTPQHSHVPMKTVSAKLVPAEFSGTEQLVFNIVDSLVHNFSVSTWLPIRRVLWRKPRKNLPRRCWIDNSVQMKVGRCSVFSIASGLR